VRNFPVYDLVCWWDQHKDKLNGTEVYGDPNDDTKPWAVKFDDIKFTHIKVEGKNKSFSKEYTKENLFGKMKEDEYLKDIQ